MAELDIAVFLRARLDERELMLRTDSPAQIAWATFRHADGSMRYTSVASSNGDVWVCDGHVVEPDSVQVVFDRAQELADVAAKRQILEAHPGGRDHPEAADYCLECGPFWRDGKRCDYPCETLRLLALPYAGHPDYDESWKP